MLHFNVMSRVNYAKGSFVMNFEELKGDFEIQKLL